MKYSSLCNVYTVIAVCSTLFELYGITYTFHTFTWRFALVIGFIVLDLLSAGHVARQKSESNYHTPFMLSMCLGFLFNIIVSPTSIAMRWIRFMLLNYFTFYLGKKYFDGILGYRVYRIIVWIATAVLLTQVFYANILGEVFVGHLPLPLRSPTYESSDFLLRYYSIFEEPGYYGIYVTPYLCMKLYQRKINFAEMFLISLALLLSTSTSNIGVLCFVLATFVFIVKPQSIGVKKLLFIKVLLVLMAVGAAYILMQTSQYDFIMNRLENGSSAESRAEGYLNFDVYFRGNILLWLFGNSLEDYPISGFATLIICFGLVGSLFYMMAFFKIFRRTNKVGQFILLGFLFINIANVEFLGNASSMLFVYPFAYWFMRNKFVVDIDEYSKSQKNEKRKIIKF